MKTGTFESNSNVAAIDGVIALAIMAVCVLPKQHLISEMRNWHDDYFHASDVVFGIAFILCWRFCFSRLRLYSRFATVPSRMTAIAKGLAIMGAPVVIYLAKFHRELLTFEHIVTMAMALFAFEVDRIFVTDYLLNLLAAKDPRRVLIIGSGRRAGKAWREIRTRYHSSIRVLGFIDDRNPEEMAPEVAQLYLGRLDDLGDTILKNVVDVILIAMPIRSCYPQMQRAITIAESVGIKVIYMGDLYHSSATQGRGFSESMFTDLAPDQSSYVMQHVAKRIADITCATLGLILVSPVMLLIAIGIKLTDPGPVFFCQERYGYRRRLFKICKFRTMVVNAEKLLPSLEHANEAAGPIFKIKEDPRVTRFGKFLRTTSLDELPQLWNVLIGEMSMVGPRPMSVRDVALFNDATLLKRFSVKAGITGLWQVSGRSSVGFDEWVAMDFRYIESWSLLMDVRIMFRTIQAVVKRSGAM